RPRGHWRRPRGGVPEPDEPRMTTTPAAAPLLKMLLAQTRSELLIRWRVPAFSVTNLVLPMVFFILIGVPIAHLRSADGVSIGAGGIRETTAVWATIITRLLAGSLPFIGLRFAIGYRSRPNAAPAVANLIYLPLSFASGLFVPLSQLPDFVQRLAPYLPSYHYAQLAWSALGAGHESLGVSLLWLGGYSALFLALAVSFYRRAERAKFA